MSLFTTARSTRQNDHGKHATIKEDVEGTGYFPALIGQNQFNLLRPGWQYVLQYKCIETDVQKEIWDFHQYSAILGLVN